MTRGHTKGGGFEREMAVRFSEWWTGGERTDVFWRTGGSGARAKVRGKKGKQTSGQHGDLAATDPIGEPLTRLVVIELKRGYKKASIHDLLDSPEEGALQQYEKWFARCEEDKELAGTRGWILITKRDRRLPMVFMEEWLCEGLFGEGYGLSPGAMLFLVVPPWKVVCMTLDEFFQLDTQYVKDLWSNQGGTDGVHGSGGVVPPVQGKAPRAGK